MITPNKTHCAGNNCPSKANCHHFTAPRDQDYVEAALYVRREAGASACDMFDPVRVVTTFVDQKAVCGRINDGHACDWPAGSICPDCGPALHDFPEGA